MLWEMLPLFNFHKSSRHSRQWILGILLLLFTQNIGEHAKQDWCLLKNTCQALKFNKCRPSTPPNKHATKRKFFRFLKG